MHWHWHPECANNFGDVPNQKVRACLASGVTPNLTDMFSYVAVMLANEVIFYGSMAVGSGAITGSEAVADGYQAVVVLT